MTGQDTFIYENDTSKYWHEVIWKNLTDWNGNLKLKLAPISATFSLNTYRWSNLNIENFIDTQNADRYGKMYVHELNKWVSLIELLEAITIPRKV